MSKKFKEHFLLRLTRWIFPKLEIISQPLATRLFAQLFFTPLHYGFPRKEKEWIEKSEKSLIIVNNRKVQVYFWGEKENPYVLFVHGWAGRVTQFRIFFQPLLDKGFRIVGFDGPAHGNSEGKRTNILEFEKVMGEIFRLYGKPHGVITHSFGGVVSLLCAMKGMPIARLITIGTPIIGEEVINTFLRAVNGSSKTGEKFKQYFSQKHNQSFDEFSGAYFIQRIKSDLELLVVHDENDKDVPIAHAEEAIRLFPSAWFIRTKGLGHTQILKEKRVIKDCIKFIE